MPEPDAPRLRGVLHQIAFTAAAGAGVTLLALSPWRWSVAVYVASLLTMLGVSAAYHRGTWGPRAAGWWQRADHAAIFLCIAGSYTPLCADVLGPVGRHLLAWVWIGAGLGIARALLWPGAPRAVVAGGYVALGWVMLAALPAVVAATSPLALLLILGGGTLYSVGALIYARRWPDPWPRTFGYHEVFHALTVGAAALHFGAIALLTAA